MAFRCMQKLKLEHYVPPVVLEEKTLESGEIVKQSVDMSEVVLPPAELFDLQNQLDAGVDLEEVNSKVLGGRTVDAESIVRKYTKRGSSEKSDNQ